MVDIVESDEKLVVELAELIDEHKGENTLVLDLRELNSWTDFFIITTVRSRAHQSGLIDEIARFFKSKKITPINPYKSPHTLGWALIDCGVFVVHLMDKERREFYELEKFWFKAKVIYQSSKSS